MPRLYDTISGHRIEYPDPTPELEAFVKRLQTLADDKTKTENDLVVLVYSKENPILDPTIFPERGAITKEVLENPIYLVMTDLIYRKRIAEMGLTAEQLAARYTLTVAEAAERLKVHTSAIIQRIHAKRLPSWVKEGRYYLDPNYLDTLPEVGRRGPVSQETEPLSYRVGQLKGSMLRIQLPVSGEPDSKLAPVEGQVERWRRVAVLSGKGGSLRFFILEPDSKENEVDSGDFYVKGKFKIAEKINNKQKAAEAFASFRSL